MTRKVRLSRDLWLRCARIVYEEAYGMKGFPREEMLGYFAARKSPIAAAEAAIARRRK